MLGHGLGRDHRRGGPVPVQAPSVARHGFRWTPVIDWSSPELRQVFRRWLPMILGFATWQINFLVNTFLLTFLPEGSVTWVNYAYRIQHLPAGLFGAAIGSVAIAEFSHQLADADVSALRGRFRHSMSMVSVLTLPAAVLLIALALPVTRLIYQHGRFTPARHGADRPGACALLHWHLGRGRHPQHRGRVLRVGRHPHAGLRRHRRGRLQHRHQPCPDALHRLPLVPAGRVGDPARQLRDSLSHPAPPDRRARRQAHTHADAQDAVAAVASPARSPTASPGCSNDTSRRGGSCSRRRKSCWPARRAPSCTTCWRQRWESRKSRRWRATSSVPCSAGFIGPRRVKPVLPGTSNAPDASNYMV